MLVLRREVDQRVFTSVGITILVIDIGPGWVQLGFEASPDILIDREEVFHAKQRGVPVSQVKEELEPK
jgi:carbon storage regulator CsrA